MKEIVGIERNSQSMEDLWVCLDCTDWDVFRAVTNTLDCTEAVTSYISSCKDCCVPLRTRLSYDEDKPWFTAKLRLLGLQKEETFRRQGRDRCKMSKYSFSKVMRS